MGEVSAYMLKRAAKHRIIAYKRGNKKHYFTVRSCSGAKYDVAVEVNCTCEWGSTTGVAQPCSHVLACFYALMTGGKNVDRTTRDTTAGASGEVGTRQKRFMGSDSCDNAGHEEG